MKPWGCVRKQCSEAEARPIVRTHQSDVRSLDEQGSKIFTPSLGYAARDRSTTCAVLAWHETKPCTEIASPLEILAGTYGGDHGRRDQRPTPLWRCRRRSRPGAMWWYPWAAFSGCCGMVLADYPRGRGKQPVHPISGRGAEPCRRRRIRGCEAVHIRISRFELLGADPFEGSSFNRLAAIRQYDTLRTLKFWFQECVPNTQFAVSKNNPSHG
jgi:hypothetical protein